MFSVLTSDSRRRRFWSPTTVAVSAGAHVLLLGGAMYASSVAPEPVRPAPEPPLIWIPPEPLPVQPREPEPVRLQPADIPNVPIPRGEGVVMPDPPQTIPTQLPEYDRSDPPIPSTAIDGTGGPGHPHGDPEVSPGPGIPVGPAAGGDGGVYTSEVVEERPKLRNTAEMQRVLQRFYPELLRATGLAGQSQIQLVVDAQGRVEPGSATVVSASHEAFIEPSLKAAERFRFSPAKIQGRAVRVVITLPITWELDT